MQLEAGFPVGQIALADLATSSPLLAPGSVIQIADLLPVLFDQLLSAAGQLSSQQLRADLMLVR